MTSVDPVPVGDAVSRGRGATTRDGCAVEVYLRLPADDEIELIHAMTPPGGTILDLGAGVGRLADPLARLGHHVVAVDESIEMLGHVRAASTVCSTIEALRLEERFDVVLLPSYLINTPEPDVRKQLLDTVARHVGREGRALLQWHPPEWIDSLRAGQIRSGRIGDLASEFEVHSTADGLVTATVRYRTATDEWSQTFSAARLTHDQVAADLRESGLEFAEHVLPDHEWLVAKPAR